MDDRDLECSKGGRIWQNTTQYFFSTQLALPAAENTKPAQRLYQRLPACVSFVV